MPKKLEAKLLNAAKRKGFSKERIGAYVYGSLHKLGWKPNKEK